MTKRPCLFIDRDGVLNFDSGYVHKPEDFRWIDGAKEACAWAKSRGYFLSLATNQSGIARGFYNEEQFLSLTEWMNDQLRTVGGELDAVYFCPYHATEGMGHYKKDSEDRKPNPGMLLKSIAANDLDPDRSYFVGDMETDMQAARAAGVTGLLFKGGNLHDFLKQHLP